MSRNRSLLIGATLALLSAACSESPVAPASPSTAMTLKVPLSGPMHTDNPGPSISNPPPGGVSLSESGSPGDPAGRTFSYSNLQPGLFDMLAWGKGNPMALTIFTDAGPVSPVFQGGAGPEAVWTSTIMAGGHSVLVRISVSVPFVSPTTDLASLGILDQTGDIGAVWVITGSSFTGVVKAFGQVDGVPGEDDGPVALPLNMAIASIPGFSGIAPTVTFTPSFYSKLKSCDSGYYLTGDGCVAAPAGSYSSGGSVMSATQCPSGQYQPDAGQYFCTAAPKGSYAEGPGATETTLCSPGYYSDTPGRSSCIAAPRGTYVEGEGAQFPVQCAAGSYNNSVAQTSCNLAPAGYYALAGAHTPTECGAGKYTSTSGNSSCTPAPAGSYAPGPHSTSSIECAVGTFSANQGQGSCTPAPAGSYVDAAGATGATQCAAGYYQPDTGQTSCIAASIGFFVGSTGAASQTVCPLGTEATATASVACTPISPLATFDALVAAAQSNSDVGKGDLNKLVNARKQLLAGKIKQVCTAIDEFQKYVVRESAKKKDPMVGGAILLQKAAIADAAIGC